MQVFQHHTHSHEMTVIRRVLRVGRWTIQYLYRSQISQTDTTKALETGKVTTMRVQYIALPSAMVCLFLVMATTARRTHLLLQETYHAGMKKKTFVTSSTGSNTKKLKRMADAERLPQSRRRLSGGSSSDDSPATQLSRISLEPASTAKSDISTRQE